MTHIFKFGIEVCVGPRRIEGDILEDQNTQRLYVASGTRCFRMRAKKFPIASRWKRG